MRPAGFALAFKADVSILRGGLRAHSTNRRCASPPARRPHTSLPNRLAVALERVATYAARHRALRGADFHDLRDRQGARTQVNLSLPRHRSADNGDCVHRHFDVERSTDLPVIFRVMAGGVAGLIGQSATYPLDIVRRRMQVRGSLIS